MTFSTTDQMGHALSLAEFPKRIISLVPSQTELLFDLGLEAEILGVTKFCIHPKDKCRKKTRIGGTKKFNFDRISALSPDLIIGNKEENYQEGIEELRKTYPVWVSDIYTLEDAFYMMESIGQIVGKAEKATDLVQKIKICFEGFSPKIKKKALYLIWKDPYMGVAEDTFIDKMMEKCGFENVLKAQKRYPTITASEIRTLNPEIILLSSEPYPFKEKHIQAFKEILPQAEIALVDGEVFSWYGSRLQYAPAYFEELNTRFQTLGSDTK